RAACRVRVATRSLDFRQPISTVGPAFRRAVGAHAGRVVQWDNAGVYNCEVVLVPYCGCVPGASQVVIARTFSDFRERTTVEPARPPRHGCQAAKGGGHWEETLTMKCYFPIALAVAIIGLT